MHFNQLSSSSSSLKIRPLCTISSCCTYTCHHSRLLLFYQPHMCCSVQLYKRAHSLETLYYIYFELVSLFYPYQIPLFFTKRVSRTTSNFRYTSVHYINTLLGNLVPIESFGTWILILILIIFFFQRSQSFWWCQYFHAVATVR